MQTVSKILDEIALIILSKDIQIDMQQREICKLKNKIDTIEQYLNAYEKICNYEHKNKKN